MLQRGRRLPDVAQAGTRHETAIHVANPLVQLPPPQDGAVGPPPQVASTLVSLAFLLRPAELLPTVLLQDTEELSLGCLPGM